MPWPLIRLSLRARLYLVCGLLILLLLAPAYYTLRQLAELRDIAFDLQSRHTAALVAIGRLEGSVADLEQLQRTYVTAPDPTVREEMLQTELLTRAMFGQLAAYGYEVNVVESSARIDSLSAVTLEIDSLMSAGRGVPANMLYQESRTLFDRTHRALQAFADTIDVRGNAAAVQAQTISQRTARTTAAATGLAAGLAVLVAILSVGMVTNPLGRLRSAMSAVASGRFVPPRDLPYGRTDEIGDLTRSFRSMAERLAELDRLKAEFVGVASHELKTPLNVVRGYVEMIEDGSYGPIEPRLEEVLGYIREQTEVLRERVDQLLALSRLEARGMEIRVETVALPELFEELRRNFAGVAAQKRIVFRVAPDPSIPAQALLDRRRVRDELLGNLLGNAFKFTPRGGTIELAARARGDWLIVEIRDTGGGIPAAELPYIFEKYYQAGHHAGKVGAGLGLAIAREIVDAHGGTIDVESERGVGTTFRVELPVQVPARTPNIDAVSRFRPDRTAEASTARPA
jgi:signal transduction histidine kinase